ncbi:MAG: 50S ribosomal protein L5 [Rectinemataceae bacterium]
MATAKTSNQNPTALAAEKKAEAAAKKAAKAATAAKSGGAPVAVPKGYLPRLKIMYRETVAPALKEEFGYSSTMQIPRFVKVTVSMGVGEAKENKKILDAAVEDMGHITGQRAIKTKARKSIAVFKIREGQEIGAKVTLRGAMMWEFLDRLMNVALPRVKDFRGVNGNAFDGHGNYSLGLNEQIIFPEIDFDKIEKIMGLNIAICTTASTDKEAKSLLARMGMPFRK